MLPTKSNPTRLNVARHWLRVAFLSSLTSCLLSLQLQAQAPPTQGLIRQPNPRTAEPTLPRNSSTPKNQITDKQTTDNSATVEFPAPKPINVSSADPVRQLEPTPAIQSVSYRSSPITLSPLETPPGWIAVEKSIREKLESCDTMLRRGAVFSARQTCWKGLEELCQVLDLHDPNGKRVDSLRRALVAMREEEDFYRFSDIQLAKPDTLSNLCFAHETPVIRNLLSQHGESHSNINPLIAAQHYRSYARDQLVQACDHHPWGADLLYALGKAFEKQAWEDRSRSALVHQHAELVYQAALETNPNQSLAATQLGYVLLQLDRPQEAKAVLVRSLQAKPSQAGLQNLAEAYRRLNDPNSMQRCIAHINQLKQVEPNSQPDIPFTEISARQFAAISPPDTTIMQGSTGGAPNISAQPQSPSRMAAQPTPQSTPESNGSQGWLPSLWR